MKNILVALDRSRLAESVLAAAVAAAKDFGAKIHLLHVIVIQPDVPTTLWGASSEEVYEAVTRDARADLDRLVASIPPELRGEVTIQPGIAWRDICAVAKERDVDLIVIGSHGHGLIDRMLGTTAARVVNHADRSVLVVRRKEAGS